MSNILTDAQRADNEVMADAVAMLVREGRLSVFVTTPSIPSSTSLADLNVTRERDAFAAIVTELAVLSPTQRQRVLDAVQASYGG